MISISKKQEDQILNTRNSIELIRHKFKNKLDIDDQEVVIESLVDLLFMQLEKKEIRNLVEAFGDKQKFRYHITQFVLNENENLTIDLPLFINSNCKIKDIICII